MSKKKDSLTIEMINEAAAKRFRKLYEYSFMTEEGEGEEDMTGVEDTMASDIPEDPSMGGAPAEMGAEEGGNMPDMQADPTAMGETPEQQGGAPGFNPQEGAADGADMETQPMQSDDEVIDVDELTNSQEETEEKVEDVSVTMTQGFDKLMGVVERLSQMIDKNTANMENIRQEIEKRNPTALEKLNMRAANDSYPFNVSPDTYWADKEANSNYRIGGEDEPDAEQYTITQGDIDSITDFRQISKDLNDSEFNQNLLNIFGLR